MKKTRYNILRIQHLLLEFDHVFPSGRYDRNHSNNMLLTYCTMIMCTAAIHDQLYQKNNTNEITIVHI